MSKVIVIGSIHLDVVSNVERIPQSGETIIGDDLTYFFGGKGANQAVAAARQGADVFMIGKVGGDSFASSLRDNLKANNINNDYVSIDSEVSSGIALIAVDRRGENSIIVSRGASGRLSATDVFAAEEIFKKGDYVLFQLEVSLDTVEKSIAFVKDRGCKVILDPAPAAKLASKTLQKIDIIKPNSSEISLLTGLPSKTDKEAILATQKLWEKTGATVIMTRGEDGVICLDKRGLRCFDAYRVAAVDTTAAGDCFAGSLAASLARGLEIDDAISLALKASAYSVTKKGAQPSLPTLKQIDEFL